jgi:hypothetical protein
MKVAALVTLFTAIFMAIFACTGWFIAGHRDYLLARYPGATGIGEEHANLLSIHRGYAIHTAAHRTGDDVMSVWQWYARHFHAEPVGGHPFEGPCTTLSGSKQYVLLRRAVDIDLCPSKQGTRVFVSQSWYLWR